MPPNSNGAERLSAKGPGLLYYRDSVDAEANPPASAEYVKEMADRIISVWTEAWPGPLGNGLFMHWHERLLGGIEPTEVIGRYRRVLETSVYEVWEDTSQGPRRCHMKGVRAALTKRTLAQAVTRACERFHDEDQAQAADIVEAVAPVARLISELLRIRPFPIANDHVAHIAFHAGYRKRGLKPPGPGLVWVSRGSSGSIGVEFNRAIARSLQPRSPSIDSLVEFLAAHSALME